jgi:hypothetical protein
MAVTINASTSSGVITTADNSGVLQLQTNNGQTAVTIDTSQNVGIGTASPGYKLDVQNGTGRIYNSTFPSLRIQNSSTGTGSNDGLLVEMSSSDALFVNYESANMIFKTADTERMRIDSSGNVQIGKTSNSTLSAGINLGSLPNFIASTASPSDGPYMQISNIAASVANGFRYISFRVGNSGNEAGSISTNGSSTVSYVTSSDYRLKENVKPMVGALDVISKLNPVTYTWKIDGSDGQGFIAHELQEVVPDAVTGKKDAVDEEGNIKPQGVDTSFLVATLTAAIQEQQTIINDLKARVETLEAK